MTALTRQRNRPHRQGSMRAHDLGNGEVLLTGALVCLNAAGYLVDGEDAAGLSFAGVSAKNSNNSAGGDGDVADHPVFIMGEFRIATSDLTADDVGEPLYLLDNNTVALGNHADIDEHIFVGYLAEFISATEAWVCLAVDAKRRLEQFVGAVAGVASGALDLSALAAARGYAGLHVLNVESVQAYVTSSHASDGQRVETTHYTVSGGDVSVVSDESLNTWHLVVTAIGEV